MKKGFTLVELLAVIVILGIIVVISVPIIYGIIKDSKKNLYDEQVAQIENAAKRWSVENVSENTNYSVTLEQLINSGFLEKKDVLDPRDNSKMNGCVKINYDSSYNQHTYKYQENNC